MSRKCDLTGKKVHSGHASQHKRGSSGGGGVWRFKAQKTKRTWKPNLRKVKLSKDGVISKYKIAMNIYKRIRKTGTWKGYTLITPNY